MGAKAITIRKYDSNIPLMTLRKSDAMTSAFHIAVPRYEGGVDLADLAWTVHINNAVGEQDIHYADGVEIGEKAVGFDWVIPQVATAEVGDTEFYVVGLAGEDKVYQSGRMLIHVEDNFEAVPDYEPRELNELQQLIISVHEKIPDVESAIRRADDAADTAKSAAEDIIRRANEGEFNGRDGVDGQPGRDGRDGADGLPGRDGRDGEDGKSVRHYWVGSTLVVSSASGSTSADLRGPAGPAGPIGPEGPAGPAGEAAEVEVMPGGEIEIPTMEDIAGLVRDVQVGGVSVVEDGVANINNVGTPVWDTIVDTAAPYDAAAFPFVLPKAYSRIEGIVQFPANHAAAGNFTIRANGDTTNMVACWVNTNYLHLQFRIEVKHGIVYTDSSTSNAKSNQSVHYTGYIDEPSGGLQALLLSFSTFTAGTTIKIWGCV